MSLVNAYDQSKQLLQAFEKAKSKYNITFLNLTYVNYDHCYLKISFDIKSKDEYLHSYTRCMQVLQETFQLGKFTSCMNGWTRWEKDEFGYELYLMRCDYYNFPCIEEQQVIIKRIEKDYEDQE